MCEEAHSNNTGIDVAELRQWAQRALCLLGNAKTALSVERRKSILFKIDPKLADLADKEMGERCDGPLFGDDFVKDMSRFVGTYSSLEKAQKDLRRVFGMGRFPGCVQGISRGAFGRGSRPFGTGFGQYYNSARWGQGSFFPPEAAKQSEGHALGEACKRQFWYVFLKTLFLSK